MMRFISRDVLSDGQWALCHIYCALCIRLMYVLHSIFWDVKDFSKATVAHSCHILMFPRMEYLLAQSIGRIISILNINGIKFKKRKECQGVHKDTFCFVVHIDKQMSPYP